MNRNFAKEVALIAVPVALQSMLQSSFSMIDQIMVGQLGEQSIAAVEIAGKPGFIYAFVIGAIGAIAGIMISQYLGKGDKQAEEKSVCLNFMVVLIAACMFFLPACGCANSFVKLFTKDTFVVTTGTSYLRIISWTFIPLGISNILGVALRCRGKSTWPLYVSLATAVINTGLNYLLIFGNCGMPTLGVGGAAYASVISQIVGAIITFLLFLKEYGKIHISVRLDKNGYIQYLCMLAPVVINEFLWSVGQSINTFVYGHMGTEELAGMSLTGSAQGLTIGALSGLAQAAGIIIGKRLGEGAYDDAYKESENLCVYSFLGSIVFTILIIVLRNPYVHIYNVSPEVHIIGADILVAFAILMPVKVQNMVLGGGIIRSGGRTKYIMIIDMLGTWLVGIPLALYTGLVLKLPIVWVYFILSQEEVVRFIISIFMFRSRKWMNTLD